MVIPRNLRETLPSPSYNVKQLKLQTEILSTGIEIAELVDSLLWISPLPEILLIVHSINREPWMDTISFK
ncbi:hydroxyphenylpyruvate reductase, partial [Fagus crenata]